MSSDQIAKRSWFWWVYAVYLLVAFVAGSYASITQTSLSFTGAFAIAFDVAALFGFYGFLRQRPIASVLFWQFFTLLYTGKFLSSLGLLIYIAIHFPWRGGAADSAMLWGFVGAILTTGLLYALYIYAFRSASMWASKNTLRQGEG